MKKILFFILIFSSFLFSNDILNKFIDAQMEIEAKLLDQNLTLDKKVDLTELQVIQYRDFFFRYASDTEKHLKEPHPNRSQINRIKLRLNGNKQRGYTNAVHRDELLLKFYDLRKGLRDVIHDTLAKSRSQSKKFFQEHLSETIVKYFSNYVPVEKEKYLPKADQSQNNITEEIQLTLKKLEYLENVTRTFSAEAIDNSALIYNTARFSNSKLFALVNKINNSEYGKKANVFLEKVHIDIAKIILLILFIVLILIIQLSINFIIKHILHHYKIKDDDRDYIQSRITKIFNYIATLMVIHLITVSYIGFETASLNISKLFSILYVILITVLLYRITNTIAYMKMESIRNSKVLKNEVVNLSLKIINGFIILIAIIVILKIFGVNLTALLSGLGIAGAAIAFAAKDSISNIFGSISILMGDVFEQGEWIETKDVNGTVVEIGLRASTIRTFDNALISIPNSELANYGVKNWSRRSIGRRIKMNIGVTYESDFDDIQQAILDIRTMLKEHPAIANERTAYNNPYRQSKLVSTEDFKGVKRTTLVYLDEFADSSINILVYCFSRTVDWAQWLEAKEDVMFKIANILKTNHLDFAYPTLTLHQVDREEEETPHKKLGI